MLRLLLPAISLPLSLLAAGHEPAKLKVSVVNGNSLSFEIKNRMHEDITRYQVAVEYPDAPGLSCSFEVTVRTPKDLRTPANCGLTTNPPTGEPMKWKARIVFVEFANGLTWKPNE